MAFSVSGPLDGAAGSSEAAVHALESALTTLRLHDRRTGLPPPTSGREGVIRITHAFEWLAASAHIGLKFHGAAGKSLRPWSLS